MSPFCPAWPFPNSTMCTWTRLCTSCSRWNIQTNKYLFGWCEAFVCAHLHTLNNKNKSTP